MSDWTSDKVKPVYHSENAIFINASKYARKNIPICAYYLA
ncbi:hypothetical protein MET9862_01304 [Methylobacterium symbioticum]|uniref:Uncharacterized protein n=1 Tax=Methylobacterium symbioticum TaxID=2584084 RepID=A0A509E964_9HYPH|nr:hypothetical protein MET9862_01304 [Methylobacterium symbioticum]